MKYMSTFTILRKILLYVCVCTLCGSGQSLLSLLIDYGRLSHMSSLTTPVPVVKEIINEAGPLESFEWIKKMVSLQMSRNYLVLWRRISHNSM